MREYCVSLYMFFFFSTQEITFPKMVANCCRFLCYFCRISRQNQKAMFDHLSYLLENSSVGLGDYGGFVVIVVIYMLVCLQEDPVCCLWNFILWLLTGKCLTSAIQIHLCCFIGNRLPTLFILPLLLPSPASPSMRGSTPLDVAAASVMDNNELALALREPDLEKVTLTHMRTQRVLLHLNNAAFEGTKEHTGNTNAL